MPKQKELSNTEAPKADATLIGAVQALEAKLDTLITLMTPATITRPEPEAPAHVPVPANPYPVPTDYREMVDSVLNKSFGVEITPLSDRPAFELAIIVPEKYTNVTPDYLKMYGADRRLRVINMAEGTLGVRDWADKVFNNFSAETRAAIVFDRGQP